MRREANVKTSSLRADLARALLVAAVLPFILVWVVSYSAIYSILSNKIEAGMRGTLTRAVKELDRTYDNLVSVSHLLSHDQILADELGSFLTTQSYAEKRRYFDSINSYLALVDHANPTAGLHFFYNSAKTELLFANGSVKPPMEAGTLSRVNSNPAFALQGPHPSLNRDRPALVVSLSRPAMLSDQGEPWEVYVESSPTSLSEALPANQLGMPFWYALVDASGAVLYSQIPRSLPVGELIAIPKGTGALLERGELLTLVAPGASGWQLVAAVRKSDYGKEIGDWFVLTTLLGVFLLAVAGVVGTSVWRSLYGPIRVLGEEIRLMADISPSIGARQTGVVEFDPILAQFQAMKENVRLLLLEVQHKERAKQQLEVENLLFQINPHFLYNTLNVVQWMARTEGQKNIVSVVSSLIRLLRYNLGKEGTVATVGQEVSALRDYVALLQARHDQQFEAVFELDERAAEVPIPRFVLQPLVENSFAHGLRDGKGTIRIRVEGPSAGWVAVSVRDDGPGMAAARLQELGAGPVPVPGLGFGIGLNYVKKVLEVHYGAIVTLEVASLPGEGTGFSFRIPERAKEG
jgi:two-component system sensor histidine kinase YesM